MSMSQPTQHAADHTSCQPSNDEHHSSETQNNEMERESNDEQHTSITHHVRQVTRSLSRELRSLVSWNCPACIHWNIHLKNSQSNHEIAIDNITSANQLVTHLNSHHHNNVNLANFTEELSNLGLSHCTNCDYWMTNKQAKQHINNNQCHTINKEPNNQTARTRSSINNSNESVDHTAQSSEHVSQISDDFDAAAPQRQNIYHLYTSGMCCDVEGETCSGLAGIIYCGQQLVAKWKQTLGPISASDAAWNASLTGLTMAADHGIERIIDVVTDPVVDIAALSTDYLDKMIEQISRFGQYRLDRRAPIDNLARPLADEAMTASTQQLEMQVWFDKSPEPENDWIMENDEEPLADENIAHELREANQRMQQMNAMALASQPFEPSESPDSRCMPPQPLNDLTEAEFSDISAICNEWVEWIANQGPSMCVIPRHTIDEMTLKSRQLLQMYFDSSFTWSQRATALCHYIALPKMVLAKTGLRGGKSIQHRRKTGDIVKSRLTAMRELAAKPPSGSNVTRTRSAKLASERELVEKAAQSAINRSAKLFQQGYIGRSARALTNSGPIGDLTDPVVKAEMIRKHPQHQLSDRAIELLETSDESEIAKPSTLSFRQLVNKMDNGSAAGYDGWNVGMVRHLIRDSENLALHLRLIHDIANGRMIAPLAQLLQRGKLVALVKQPAGQKPDGTKTAAAHRPIMISTCVYRLAARLASDSVSSAAARQLSPLQLGVATPGALEAVIHTARQALTTTSVAALQLDIENAFNTISRSHVIITVMEQPWLKPLRSFVKMAYGLPTPILMPDLSG